jgi:hypothetical protein
MLVVLQTVLAGAGMLLQAVRGYHRYEPLVYLKLLFGIKLVDYVLLAALAMTVHVIVNNKYIGHIVVVAVFVSTMLRRAHRHSPQYADLRLRPRVGLVGPQRACAVPRGACLVQAVLGGVGAAARRDRKPVLGARAERACRGGLHSRASASAARCFALRG